jgi:hypothetical protein
MLWYFLLFSSAVCYTIIHLLVFLVCLSFRIIFCFIIRINGQTGMPFPHYTNYRLFTVNILSIPYTAYKRKEALNNQNGWDVEMAVVYLRYYFQYLIRTDKEGNLEPVRKIERTNVDTSRRSKTGDHATVIFRELYEGVRRGHVLLYREVTKKSNTIPVTFRGGLYSCEMLRIPYGLHSRFTDGGDNAGLARRPRSTRQQHSLLVSVLISVRG